MPDPMGNKNHYELQQENKALLARIKELEAALENHPATLEPLLQKQEPVLGEDQMLCPRCAEPVDVNPDDLLWACPGCGYDYKEFDVDLDVDINQAEGLSDE